MNWVFIIKNVSENPICFNYLFAGLLYFFYVKKKLSELQFLHKTEIGNESNLEILLFFHCKYHGDLFVQLILMYVYYGKRMHMYIYLLYILQSYANVHDFPIHFHEGPGCC